MTTKIQIFLTSIEVQQKEYFKNKFIKNITKENKTDKSTPMWIYSPSLKNLKIWNNMNSNDWILFYFDGRYSFAGKIYKKKRSKNITKVPGIAYQDEHLLVFCKEVFEIKHGFRKINSDMGLNISIPEIHKIKLIQVKERFVDQILEKHHTIESYLNIKISNFKNKDITKIIPSSMKREPSKIKTTILRRIRDTTKTKKLKKIYNNKCQICSYSFPTYVESGYSEVHHVWPMADNGDDDFDNMLVLCPNHHAEFDYRVIQFNSKEPSQIEDLKGSFLGMIHFKKDHLLNAKNILFHNSKVRETFES